MNSDQYLQELLLTWEATYKKGQLTFWLLLALRDEPRYAAELPDYISGITKGSITCEGQSVYRALRKFYDLELVDYELREGSKGPDRKYYTLTKLGTRLLTNFVKRNISILYNSDLKRLLQAKGNPHDQAL